MNRLLLITTLGISLINAFADKAYDNPLTCQAFRTRHEGEVLKTTIGKIWIGGIRNDWNPAGAKVTLLDVVGELIFGNASPDSMDGNYEGVFRFASLKNNTELEGNANKYTDHFHFDGFNASMTMGKEADVGMRGKFVLSTELKSAHYIFKAGDHMGGTVDFFCYREKF